jgi:hypothetical protein
MPAPISKAVVASAIIAFAFLAHFLPFYFRFFRLMLKA